MPKKSPKLTDDRQIKFLEFLLDSKSPHYKCVATASEAAGFDPDYGAQLLYRMPKWLEGAINKEEMVSKAENYLDTYLSPETEVDDRTRLDAVKFTLSRLAKDSYSEKVITDGSGQRIEVVLTNYKKPKIIS